MTRAALECVNPRIGLVIAPTSGDAVDLPEGFAHVAGGHPVPTDGSERGGRAALALARSIRAEQRLLVLLSGGASALMAAPADGITLADKRATTDRLLRAGADIHALNTVRKHVSTVKGG